jgi:L-glutamine-phosphate cytidylyltransferase
MKVIIPAAGIGSRLKPFTENIPKCLFKLKTDETILERMIRIVRKHIDAEIYVLTGFQHEMIERTVKDVRVVYNPFFPITNSISSVWFAREHLNDDLILINSDLVFDDLFFKDVLQFGKPSFVTLDSSKTTEADYKVATFNDRVVFMGKTLKTFTGEYAGITKLSKDAAKLLRTTIERMVIDGQTNEWYETALVSMILNDNFELNYRDISKYSWAEMDAADDVLKAKRIFETEKLRNE